MGGFFLFLVGWLGFFSSSQDWRIKGLQKVYLGKNKEQWKPNLYLNKYLD